MALSVKHAFTSAKSDGLDTTKVQPSNWNAEHTLLAAVDKVLGTDSGGTTVQELACTAAGRAILAAVDAAAQRAALGVMTIPIGGSYSWHSNTLPVVDTGMEVGWMNGQAISRTTYSALFAILGTTYGIGDGSSTFNLPNACEVSLVGRSTMGGAASRSLITHLSNTTVLGTLIGEGRHTMLVAELATHLHAVGTLGTSATTHSHGITEPNGGLGHQHALSTLYTGGTITNNMGTGAGIAYVNNLQTNGLTDLQTTGIVINNESLHVHAVTGSVANNGSSTPFNVVQPGLITNFVIRLK